ncbi:dihydropteroate synthase [Saccharopolyspora sp. NPDC000995]
MQRSPSYVDVLAEVREFLCERIEVCAGAGIAREHVVIDPGFGFGKNREHNLTLLRSLSAFTELGAPVMAGLSRKEVPGEITGRPVPEREAVSSQPPCWGRSVARRSSACTTWPPWSTRSKCFPWSKTEPLAMRAVR